MEKDGTIDGLIVSRIKGGFSVDIGVKAFLPASQTDFKGASDRLGSKKLKFKILKLNKKKGNIIVSRRALMDRNRDAFRQEILQGLQEGQTITGQVKNLTDYGAFIDMGGMDGLLHITDMSWGRIGHPSEILTVGQEASVKVLKVDPESGKVSLGLKQLTPDPWEQVSQKYPVGSRHRGRVVNITDYGAFVELQQGVEGLVHISEMSWSRKIKHPSKLVAVGDVIETAVLGLDPDARRISLGIKQLGENPWQAVYEKYPVGARIRGPVRSVTEFGIFVGLTPEVDGLVHISDLFWVRPGRPPGELFPKNTEVETIVLQVDRENERISLGIKQLSDDPWPRVKKDYAVATKHEGTVIWKGEKGVAIQLEAGVEGFISQEDSPSGEIRTGDPLRVVVHSLDERERRIVLGPVVEERK